MLEDESRDVLTYWSDLSMQPISRNALTILINLSEDPEVLQNVANDEAFQESLMLKITVGVLPGPDIVDKALNKPDSERERAQCERDIYAPSEYCKIG